MNASSLRYVIIGIVLGGAGIGAYYGIRALVTSKPAERTNPDVGTALPRGDAPPLSVPEVRFVDVTDKAGIRFQHFNGAAGRKLLPETMGPGVAVLDYDGDGKPDLFFVNSCPWPGHPNPPGGPPKYALYRNKGDGTFEDVSAKAGVGVTGYGMGVAVGDIDNDGWPDLFITGVGGHLLLHNVADGTGRRFVDITGEAGVRGAHAWPNVSAEDWYKFEPPIPFGSSATFVDYDGDGKLDLFVCHYITWSPARDLKLGATLTGTERAYAPPKHFEGAQCSLYRNVDGRRFEDVSAKAGIHVFTADGTDATARQRPAGKALGVIVCDPDEDGWPDLIVANDTVANFFFHNIPGPQGTRRFEEIGLGANVAYAEGVARGAMGVDWGEFRPGRHAAVITNFANEPNSFLSLSSPKLLHFSDHAVSVGLSGPSRALLKFGTFFFDFDLDGRQDLLTANGHLEPEITAVNKGQTYRQPAQLFWNTGGVQRLFEPMTPKQAGDDLFKPIVGRGCAYLDFDGDGDLDVVLTENGGPARLLRNDGALGHHGLRLELVGDGKRSARDAVGAVVTVAVGQDVQTRYVVGSRGYLSQSEKVLTFGLGKATKADRVTVRWPGKDAGAAQEWQDLAADATYELRQGEAAARRTVQRAQP